MEAAIAGSSSWGARSVTGVLRNVPRNSHFRFDFLASLSTLDSLQGYLLVDWRRADFYTYILLSEGSSPEQVEGKLPGFVKRRINPDDADRVRFFLQPLTSIHLHSHLEGELERNGDIADISVFAAIALFILIVAGINFMNLSIAYSFHRLLETAIRKILGAERKQIIIQFIGESVITAGLALIIALALVEICLPLFHRLAGKDVGISYYSSIPSLFGVLLAGIVFGVLAGFYPAFLISRHSPVSIIKGSLASGRRNGIRVGVLSSVRDFHRLVIGTGIAADQIGFLIASLGSRTIMYSDRAGGITQV